MITDQVHQARVQSALTERFHLGLDDNGRRWIAIGGYLMDYATFCTMLVWRMSGSVSYISIISKRPDLIDQLKEMNPTDMRLAGLEGYPAIKHLYYKVGRLLSNYNNDELHEQFGSMISTS